MSNISPVQSTQVRACLDAEEVLLMQEYENVKAKLTQIQEKRRKELEEEKGTASLVQKDAGDEGEVAAWPNPKGVEYGDINTVLPETNKGDHMEVGGSLPFSQQALSVKEGQENSVLDLDEEGDTDWESELSDEDIGTGDPNVNLDIDPFDQPSSKNTDTFDLDSTLASNEERDEDDKPDKPERLGQNEWRIAPPPECTYSSLKEAKEAALELCADRGFEIAQTTGKRRMDVQPMLGSFDAHDMESQTTSVKSQRSNAFAINEGQRRLIARWPFG